MLSALKLQSAPVKDGKAKLDLGMSQGELALLIGASRPKVNIALTMLEDMGCHPPGQARATPATSRFSRAWPTWNERHPGFASANIRDARCTLLGRLLDTWVPALRAMRTGRATAYDS
jgi:hypothetical protein